MSAQRRSHSVVVAGLTRHAVTLAPAQQNPVQEGLLGSKLFAGLFLAELQLQGLPLLEALTPAPPGRGLQRAYAGRADPAGP